MPALGTGNDKGNDVTIALGARYVSLELNVQVLTVHHEQSGRIPLITTVLCVAFGAYPLQRVFKSAIGLLFFKPVA